MEIKPRVPPFRELPDLLKLLEEKTILDEKAAAKAKKLAESGENNEGEEESKKDNSQDMQKYKILEEFDFPTYPDKGAMKHIVDYNRQEITLYEIFGEYGTMVRPKENPKFDPKPPPPKEKKATPKPPTPKPKKETEEGEEGEEAQEETPVVEEEPEEEPFIPPIDRELYYDFSTHNGKDPILLALMIKGKDDEFTL
jgi:hypothetical protein